MSAVFICTRRRGKPGSATGSGKKEADSETDAMPDAGVYYYKDIDEKNVAWAQEDGLQYADNQLVLTMTDGASEKEVKN